MFLSTTILSILLIPITQAHTPSHQHPLHPEKAPQSQEDSTWTPPSQSVRENWMHHALTSLKTLTHSPCPHEPFGTVIINHTSPNPSDLGDLICVGANDIASGNPTLHGEIAAINNCSKVLTNPDGHWKLTSEELSHAWKDLTLYTTAEPCAMCASAIRWAGMRECVFGTSAGRMRELGWPVIEIGAEEVFGRSGLVGRETGLLSVGSDETDPYLGWQYVEGKCPGGCVGDGRVGSCREKGS